MGIKQLSKGISVGRFFAQANWQGLKKAMEVVEQSTTNDDFIPSLDLTVKDFFTHHNWRGVKKMAVNMPVTGAVEENFTFSLKVSVSDFFQAMKWEGTKIVSPAMVAQNPVMETKKRISQPKQELNLGDLSDLF
ncbi:MAG: hypothetical protein IGQ45_01370 [Cyanobacterium sp. T60_A2020_053]|nr:hypothetical protein [Cyanobacterium sp. T60_A2020_053]